MQALIPKRVARDGLDLVTRDGLDALAIRGCGHAIAFQELQLPVARTSAAI
jgi:hypothetical protein